MKASANIDPATVAGFGEEWSTYTQEGLNPVEQQQLFDRYFSLFPFDELPEGARGFDLGCGTGRWAILVAPRVGRLACIDPAHKALQVARRKMQDVPNVEFHECGVDEMPMADESQDFGYSIGVLHHIPDTEKAMDACVRKLKPGAPFLLYIYYSFDNRPAWFRALWEVSEVGRAIISRSSFVVRQLLTTMIAAAVYWPLARLWKLLGETGVEVSGLPLSDYRQRSFYTMRTDALDRFGTRLEQRFSRAGIEGMMRRCGLVHIRFRAGAPYWVACGRKSAT